MALHTDLAHENFAPPRDQIGGYRIGIFGGIERHQVHTNRIESLVWVTETDAPLLRGQDLKGAELHRIGPGNKRRIARDVFRPSQPVSTCRIEIAAVVDLVQVRDLGRIERAAMRARERGWPVVAKHSSGVGIVPQLFNSLIGCPWYCELPPYRNGARVAWKAKHSVA